MRITRIFRVFVIRKNENYILFASILGFLSNGFDLFPEYGQSRIYTDRFRQLFISPDGYGQFRVQLVKHDCSHMVFVCNRSQPPVFFPVLMPLYPTDGKQGKEYEHTTDTSPCVRVLVPAIGNFAP